MHVTEPLQEYLEALWVKQFHERKPSVKTNDLAGSLKKRAPSVTQALTRLEKLKLVKRNPYYGVSLTAKGKAEAAAIVRRHMLTELFFMKFLGLSESDADAAACALEHTLTKDAETRMCELLGHPRTDSHGRAIPRGECCG